MTKEITEGDKFARFATPQVEGQEYTRMKEIRLSVPLSEADVPEGHYYSVDFNVSQGEKPIHKDLGETLKVVILRDAMKIRKWDTDERRHVYDSTEFRSFTEPVVLYDSTGADTVVKAALPYTHKNREAPMIGGSGDTSLRKNLGLRIRYIAYILYEDEVYRMSFTATDNAGAGEDDMPLGFNDYGEKSFMDLRHKCNEMHPDRMFFFNVSLRSKVHSKKLRLKTFVRGGEINDVQKETVLTALDGLYTDLSAQMWGKFARVMENTDVSSLDEYSQKMLEVIEKQGGDALLYAEEKTELPEPTVKDAEVVDTAKEAEIVFPPSDEDVKKHNEKANDMRKV